MKYSRVVLAVVLPMILGGTTFGAAEVQPVEGGNVPKAADITGGRKAAVTAAR